MMLWRKVAQAASAGFVKASDFNDFWPTMEGEKEESPSWGETSIELRKQILAKFSKR